MLKISSIRICCKNPHLKLPPYFSGDNELNRYTPERPRFALCMYLFDSMDMGATLAWKPAGSGRMMDDGDDNDDEDDQEMHIWR